MPINQWLPRRVNGTYLATGILLTLLASVSLGVVAARKRQRKNSENTISAVAVMPEPSWSGPPDNTFPPRPLEVDATFAGEGHFSHADAEPLIEYPVGIAWAADDNKYFVCNYANLFFIDLNTRECRKLEKPAGLRSQWVPTDLAYCAATGELFIANYYAKNIVVLDVKDPACPRLACEITHPHLVGAEGIDVSDDGEFLAVADYDGERASLFRRDGSLVWSVPDLPGVHGIAFGVRGDETFIVAGLLQHPELVRIEMDGTITKRTRFVASNSADGMPDAFLFPSGVERGSRGDEFIITDAYRGQILHCSEDLVIKKAVGGNGPSVRLFNNPYNAALNRQTGQIVVADTFRDRLVEMNLDTGKLHASLHLSNHARNPSRTQKRTPARQLDAASLVSDERQMVARNAPSRTRMSLAALPSMPASAVGTLSLQTIHVPALSGNLATDGMRSLFGGYVWRFLAGKSGEMDGEPYFLLWSPQSSGLVMGWRGISIPLALPKDVWLQDGQLVYLDYPLKNEAHFLRAGVQQANKYLLQCEQATPLHAMHASLFADERWEDFVSKVRGTGVSANGKRFVEDLIDNAENGSKQRALAAQFLNEPPSHLAELLLAETILASDPRR